MKRDAVMTKLKAAKPRLCAEYGVVKLGVFGSVARDEAAEGSDVDVVVRLGRPDLFDLVALRMELMEILETEVDLVHEHDRMRPLLAGRIVRDVIYV